MAFEGAANVAKGAVERRGRAAVRMAVAAMAWAWMALEGATEEGEVVAEVVAGKGEANPVPVVLAAAKGAEEGSAEEAKERATWEEVAKEWVGGAKEASAVAERAVAAEVEAVGAPRVVAVVEAVEGSAVGPGKVCVRPSHIHPATMIAHMAGATVASLAPARAADWEAPMEVRTAEEKVEVAMVAAARGEGRAEGSGVAAMVEAARAVGSEAEVMVAVARAADSAAVAWAAAWAAMEAVRAARTEGMVGSTRV